MMTVKEMVMYDVLVTLGVATAEELNLARDLVDGSWTEVMNKVLYAKTGYRTLDQLYEEDEE